MSTVAGVYTDWCFIDYNPVLAEILPESLLPYLTSGQTILDVGCNKGNVSIFIAKHGFSVTGIDINQQAVEIARERVAREDLEGNTHFLVTDVLDGRELGEFDVVLMIRLLTCFPGLANWQRLLSKVHSLIKNRGMIYVNDFLLTEENDIYRKRYDTCLGRGRRHGNFEVFDENGRLQFIAHHHTHEEMNEIISPYEQIKLNIYKSISMYGNDVNMFEFIGRKIN